MRNFLMVILLVISTNNITFAQYDKYFTKEAMRLDFMHSGGLGREDYNFVAVAKEAVWGGNPDYLIDTTFYGVQLFKIIDFETKKEIFSKSYNTLFNEWLDLDEAKSISRAYPESIQFPFPKAKVIIEFYSRAKDKTNFKKLYSHIVDPNSYKVINKKSAFKSFDVHYSGSHTKKLDIVLLAEGYDETEEQLFRDDCAKFVEQIFSIDPYKSRMRDFNVHAVWTPSKESGVSLPGENIWRETAFAGSFYTFGSERYFMIKDFTKVSIAAGAVPYDAIYILGNTLKYGGGGIYNFYGMGSARNKELAGEVHVHEMGHSIAGLADEYAADGFDNDQYSSKREPFEENITTLKDFRRKKIWNSLLTKGVKIPTKVKDADNSTVGVFEGAGYSEHGVYRPVLNCMMRSFAGDRTFCPICTEALNKTIDRYSK